MKNDWLFVVDNSVCDVRTVGVLVQNGKILVQREREGTEFALPGGHIKIGETLEEGLIREYREEIGVDISCEKLLWSEECFWEWNGRTAHNFAFYHLIRLCEPASLPDIEAFIPHKDNHNVVFGWMPIEEIQHVTIYPEFLKEELSHLDGPMKHFVSRG